DDGASGDLAAALLGQPGEDGSLTRLFEALDQERDEEMLKAVFMALGRHASRPAVERLARAARGIDPRTPRSVEVRIAAVEALGEAGTPESIAALRSLLHDPEERVRGAALWVVTDPRSPSRP
ncbi:MAG TPA: HEAT repeat domain-containing protein, partial [Gemmatimonadaceae bacterium]|nr:HEAT repeat domain-containing protein [Gemmatimonadaceae bacterium]